MRWGLATLIALYMSYGHAEPIVQEDTLIGLARSASMMKAIKNVCAKIHAVDMDRTSKIELLYLELGIRKYGFDEFGKAVAAENGRRYNEVEATGAHQWCTDIRAHLEKLGQGSIYSGKYEPNPEKVVLPEEMAQHFARAFVGQSQCNLKTSRSDLPVEPIIRSRRLDPEDFKPKGRYEVLIVAKMRETTALLQSQQLSCSALNQSVKSVFPELFD